MDSNEPNKDSYMEKRKAAVQLSSRDTYSQISSSRKEELLLARRMKNQHSVKHASLKNSTPTVPEQSTSSWCKAGVSKQRALTIREPPPLLEKALHHGQSFVTMMANNKEKGKGIWSPFVISETGGTSNTFDQHHLQTQNVILTKDIRPTKAVSMAATNQRSEYVALKKASNCQYCDAKRFEYEPAGFCCSSGSIRLTSYKMPSELSKLYFEKTEESENFRTYIRTYNNMFTFTSLGVKMIEN